MNRIRTISRNIRLRARFFVRSDGVVFEKAKPLGSCSPLRREVFRRDGGRCQYCDRDVVLGVNGRYIGYDDPRWGIRAEVDHALARSRGGQNTLANLVLACFDCNHRKHYA